MRTSRWLDVAALGTWLVCAITPLLAMGSGRFSGAAAAVWTACFFAYGAALAVVLWRNDGDGRAGRRRLVLPLLAVQSLAAVAMNQIAAVNLGGTGAGLGLLVIVAAILPHVAGAGLTWLWIAAQTILMTAGFWRAADTSQVVTAALAAGGFELFAAASAFLSLSERRARENLTLANAELHATRALLAENSRVAERLRISRDLHDALGHHLTALSLQLDVASRLSEGKAAEHTRQAHAITRLLLGDVRAVVSRLRDTSRFDLTKAVGSLARGSTAPIVHIEVGDALEVDEVGQAQTLLRCVQEIITNTARHAGAQNLWIRIAASRDGITLDARDDGRGVMAVTLGNGLKGMRERFEEYSGRIEFSAGEGRGFRIHGFMPRADATGLSS